jgi:hypothetical protein
MTKLIRRRILVAFLCVVFGWLIYANTWAWNIWGPQTSFITGTLAVLSYLLDLVVLYCISHWVVWEIYNWITEDSRARR